MLNSLPTIVLNKKDNITYAQEAKQSFTKFNVPDFNYL